MRKKIVHVLNVFPVKSETFIVNHIVETLKCGYQPILLVNQLRSLKSSSQIQLLQQHGLYNSALSFNPRVPNNKVRRLLRALKVLFRYLPHYKLFLKSLDYKTYGLKAKTLKLWFQVGVFLPYRDVSIFHGHFGVSGKLLEEMKALGVIKGEIIVSFYGYDTFSTLENRPKLKAYYKELFLDSKYIITSSNFLKRNLLMLDAPKSKITVNHVGVDIDTFKYQRRAYEDVLQIITVGRFIKLKGQHLGLEVIRELKLRGHNIQYILVGFGEQYQFLKKKIKDLDLSNEVQLLGSKTQIEIKELLYKQHLFLMTSITGEHWAEGQGLVTAEAQATGMPIVGFNSGGIPETIKDRKTGYIVEEGNIDVMADCIEKFIRQPDLITTMGFNARLYVEKHFSNALQSQKLIDLYKK